MYRILVVDDEKFIRKSICNRMDWEALGIEVAGLCWRTSVCR